MWMNVIILFLSALVPGLMALRHARVHERNLRFFLVFAGAYLFSITVVHLIPDLFLSKTDAFDLGLYILLGFFLQKVLERFTRGVEHGHVHTHLRGTSVIYLLAALVIHSFLEGSIMTGSLHSHHTAAPAHGPGGGSEILLGVVLHRIPAAFALMTLLIIQLKQKEKAFILLLIFALSAPLGLLTFEYLVHSGSLSEDYLIPFFAVVTGGFLQISTTIFTESDPQHRLDWPKLSCSILGALAAVIAQLAFHARA